MIYGYLYRWLMRLSHKYHWHYMPPSYPDGDTLLWCHWCGAKHVAKRRQYIDDAGLEMLRKIVGDDLLHRQGRQS